MLDTPSCCFRFRAIVNVCSLCSIISSSTAFSRREWIQIRVLAFPFSPDFFARIQKFIFIMMYQMYQYCRIMLYKERIIRSWFLLLNQNFVTAVNPILSIRVPSYNSLNLFYANRTKMYRTIKWKMKTEFYSWCSWQIVWLYW